MYTIVININVLSKIATYDPGWNDPPPMPTSGDATNKTPKPKLNLNKRVAFPLQSSGSNSSNTSVKTTSEGLPLPFSTAKYQPPAAQADVDHSTPVQAPILPPPPSNAPPSTSDAIESAAVSTSDALINQSPHSQADYREYCKQIFHRVTDAISPTMNWAKIAEIRKRLEVLNGMWLDGKLSAATELNLYELAKGTISTKEFFIRSIH